MTQQPQIVLLRGGLNIVTPAIATPPGMVIGCSNYESDVSGYARFGGYERYDGRVRPSGYSYAILGFDAGTAAVSVGQTITGLTSTTAAEVLAVVIESGSYGGGDAAGYFVVPVLSGGVLGYLDNEQLQVGGITKALANGTAETNGAETTALDNAYMALAADDQRANIAAPAGSGDVLGGFVLNGVNYCFRDNAGVGVLYKATTGGWVAQTLGSYLKFDAGSAEFFEGDVITGGTSGATGEVMRVVLLSGAWSGTAAGFVVFQTGTVVGTFQNNEAITGGTGAAVVDGTLVANALAPGGRYQTTIHNFFGAGKQPRAYVANGVNRAFEYDDQTSIIVPLFTGLIEAYDKPTRVAQFAEHLILGYENGYGVISEIGDPLEYKTTSGAGDFNIGHSFADFIETASTSLVILSTEKVGFMTGTDVDTFVISWISEEAGAEPWTGQMVGSPMYLDDLGVRRLSATQAFGNWRMGTLSQAIEPAFKRKQDTGFSPVASVRARARDQYRLFYDDMTGISVYVGRKDPECMLFDLAHRVTCTWVGTLSGETRESIFFGTNSASGAYVMEMDRGRSFDGEAITAFIRLAWNTFGSPSVNKRMHSATLETDAQPSASLSISVDVNYGDPNYTPSVESISVAEGGGFWNIASWNDFIWSSQTVGVAQAYIDGFGSNFSTLIASNEIDDELPHTLSALTFNYSMRGLKR